MSNYDKQEVVKVLNMVREGNLKDSSILTIINSHWFEKQVTTSEYKSFFNWLKKTKYQYGCFPETHEKRIEFVNNALKELE